MLNHGQHPLNFLSLQTHSHVPAAVEFTENMQYGTERAQQSQKAYANKGRRDVTYDVGEMLLLNTRNVRWKSRGTPKLMPRWVGPYKVLERVGPVAYRIDLPASMTMWPVFHVSLLQPWREDGRLQPPPPKVLLNGETVFTVEKILNHRTGRRKNMKEFLVRWEGYDPANDSWEPEANIHDPTLVQDY